MIRWGSRAPWALAMAGFGVLLALLGAATFAAPHASARGVWLESPSARQAGHFWTPGRMQAAKPLELASPRFDSHARPMGLAGPAGSEFGSNFEQVPDPTAPGFRVHGVLFVAGFFGYGRCSGTAVDAPNKSVVITAAHCLEGSGRRSNLAFIPGYRYGQRPFGVFPVRWLDRTKQWRGVFSSANFDVGAMVVGRNQRGETLGEAVGGAKIAFNLKPKQTFDVHGYPAEEPFDGETQRLCKGVPFIGHDPTSFEFPGPLNLANDCDVTGGASGGGWMIRGGTTLNGVTSYGYFDTQTPVFGPYFGKEAARLYSRAARVR
jgi:V8-like Glu-specific endopeptidase